MADHPLHGLKVLDLSTVLAGPNCARYLADFGADVIKVERPDGGDSLRNLAWRDPRDGEGLWWKMVSRNKRTIALDLKADPDVQLFRRLITDADVDKALTVLREQRTDYKDVTRPVAAGDIAVVNYTGTSDGKPITDTAPTARGLTEQKAFWIRCEPGQFIPGFTEQLHGMNAGEKRTVNVDFPPDFVAAQLVGKKGVYEVELVQVKERLLPEVTDEFAKSFGAESLEKLRAGIQQDLTADRNEKAGRAVRDQLIGALLGKVQFDLPESIVLQATRNVVYSIVQENQQRGIPKEAVARVNSAIVQIIKMPDVQERFAGLNLEAIGSTPEEFAKFLKDDLAKYAAIAKAAGIKPE